MHLYVQSVSAIHVCVPKTSIPQNVKNCSGRKFGGALRLHQSFLCKTFLLSYTQLPICLTGFYYTTRVQRKIKSYSKRRTQILRKCLFDRSRSSYLLHSCSTGMETSRHCRDPQTRRCRRTGSRACSPTVLFRCPRPHHCNVNMTTNLRSDWNPPALC